MKGRKFKKCCAEEIKRIWEKFGGSMNVINWEDNCPVCGDYIGLTQTPKEEAVKFLKVHELEYNGS